MIKNFLGTAQSLFLRGFFTLLPIALTIALVKFFLTLISSWLRPIYHLEPEFLQRIPYSEFFLVLFVILGVGLVMQLFIVTHVFDIIETSILNKIPLLRQVYFGIKQLVNALNPEDQITFKHVVYVPFLGKSSYTLGFLTNYAHPSISPDPNTRFACVFIPTTPNPTTGFYVIVPESECVIVSLTRQEAMTIIISGGILQPDR